MLFHCIIVAVLASELLANQHGVEGWWNLWTYDDETSWPGDRCKFGGRRQSPIDIKRDDAVIDYNNVFIKYGPLDFKGYNQVLMTGVNNGHTIQFSTEGEKGIHPILSGGPLEFSYRMEQMHFHWLSEHAIEGRKYPLEVHFVHVRTDLSVEEALSVKNGLAVVAVFCNVVANIRNDDYDMSLEYMQYIPHLSSPGSRMSGILLDTTKLLTSDRTSYYTYEGSLTSPECNEVVLWIVFDIPITISDGQYAIFGKMFNGKHNFRTLQPLRLHVVYHTAPDSIWTTPYIVSVFKDMYKTVADFFTNMTAGIRCVLTDAGYAAAASRISVGIVGNK